MTATVAPAEQRRAPLWIVVVAILAASLSLRSLMAGISPLEPSIRRDLGLSSAWFGALTTLPVICMGLFAPPAARIGRSLGATRAVSLALVAMAIGNLLRLGGHHVALLYLGTLVAGLGIAVAGTLIPGIVKGTFPAHRAGLGTSVFMASMMIGAGAAAALAVPFEEWLGGWYRSLGVWGVVAALGLAGWLPLDRTLHIKGGRDARPATDTTRGLPWRSVTAWVLAIYLTTQSWQFYTSMAWLSPTYVDEGWSAGSAGLLLSAFMGAQLVAGFAAPVLADRVPDIRALLLGAATICFVGEVGIWLWPTAAPLGWSLILGFGQGAAFPLGVMLLVRFGATPDAAARLTAMAYCISYTSAAFGPTVMGAIRDAWGGFAPVWAILAAIMVPQSILCLMLHPRREQVH